MFPNVSSAFTCQPRSYECSAVASDAAVAAVASEVLRK